MSRMFLQFLVGLQSSSRSALLWSWADQTERSTVNAWSGSASSCCVIALQCTRHRLVGLRRDGLGEDRDRDLRGRVGTDVEAGGAVAGGELGDGPIGEPVRSGLLHLASAKRTDVADLTVQRRREGGPGELEVVCRDDDLVEWCERGDEACGRRDVVGDLGVPA